MDVKVISWCFYVDMKNIERLCEYLVGLKCNQRAARWWFPEWQCRLYYDSTTLNDYPVIKKYIENVCYNGIPMIEMIPCRIGYPCINERYRPFFEKNITACIVRDIDSILSKIDADHVNNWLYNTNFKIFKYLEYQMPLDYAMGGGIAIRGNLNNEDKYIKPVSVIRGDDELLLKNILRKNNIKESDSMTIITRMSCSGIYYIFNGNLKNSPKEQEILWMIPFYDSWLGYAYKYHGCQFLKDVNHLEDIITFSKCTPIKKELIGHHWYHYNNNINNLNIETHVTWVR